MNAPTQVPSKELGALLTCAKEPSLTNAAFTWAHIKLMADEIDRLQRELADRPALLDGLSIQQWKAHAKAGWKMYAARAENEPAAVPGVCRHGTRDPHECRQCIDDDVIRTRAFWSRDRKELISAYVSDKDITLMDDNGHILEPAGDEQRYGPTPPPTAEVVTISRKAANLIRGAFLPDNPRRMRSAHPDVRQAAEEFIAALTKCPECGAEPGLHWGGCSRMPDGDLSPTKGEG